MHSNETLYLRSSGDQGEQHTDTDNQTTTVHDVSMQGLGQIHQPPSFNMSYDQPYSLMLSIAPS